MEENILYTGLGTKYGGGGDDHDDIDGVEDKEWTKASKPLGMTRYQILTLYFTLKTFLKVLGRGVVGV